VVGAENFTRGHDAALFLGDMSPKEKLGHVQALQKVVGASSSLTSERWEQDAYPTLFPYLSFVVKKSVPIRLHNASDQPMASGKR